MGKLVSAGLGVGFAVGSAVVAFIANREDERQAKRINFQRQIDQIHGREDLIYYLSNQIRRSRRIIRVYRHFGMGKRFIPALGYVSTDVQQAINLLSRVEYDTSVSVMKCAAVCCEMSLLDLREELIKSRANDVTE
jgi:hypothetical protein